MKEKDEEKPQNNAEFPEMHKSYQRNYTIIVCLCIAAIITIWYFINTFWGAVALTFGFWSWEWYEEGAQEESTDKRKHTYPKEGFRYMIRSWQWFIFLAIIAYFLCRIYLPGLFN